ncbi:MAG: polysaccharide deacetylase family protein [Firmicutes bacterium]|nr:polysaccharide deacetylase family protein [Bacillota bacterium]
MMQEETTNTQKNRRIIISIALTLLLMTGFFAMPNNQGKILTQWHHWFGENQPVDGTQPEPPKDVPPPSPEPEAEPQPKQQPDPAPNSPLPTPPTAEEKDDPIIYVGQQLIIPIAGEVRSDTSQVVKEGILTGDQKQIALTFDAGWLYDQTYQLLDLLDSYQVKSTFFTRALWVKSYPDLAQEIKIRGHIIENHSLTHGHLVEMTDLEIRNELRESTRIIKEITASEPYLFRPPYGEYNDRLLTLLAEEGYPYTIMWTVDTHDWAEEIRGQKVTADYLVERVLTRATNNGIILMHIGGYKTIESLPRIIDGLRDQGYRLVTVNEMMPPSKQEVLLHTVQQGDTMYALARTYGVTVDQLMMANGL